MTVIQHLQELADVVMPHVAADIAALYPAAAAIESAVSTRASAWQGAPPRAVWVPTRDAFQGPSKTPRGGQDAQRSIATRVAGVRVELWGADATQTEDLVEAVVRALLLSAGPAGVGVSIVAGQWIEAPGQTALGEGYALSLTLPLDVRAARAPLPPPTGPVVPTLAVGSISHS